MHRPEIELKFEITDEEWTRLRRHSALCSPGHKSRLRSTYYDTPDRHLRNADLALRVRENGDGRVQTLKWEKRSDPFVRDEWETKIRSDRPDAAALTATPAGRILNGSIELLEPVFTTTVQRTCRVWSCEKDRIELSLDRGEIACGGRREPIQELELELKGGRPDALFELAGLLTEGLALPLMFRSKAERGYQLADERGWQPERAQPIIILPETRAADAFRQVALSCLAQVANNAILVTRHRAMEALHQSRVGLRRLRSALTVFRSLVQGDDYEHVKTETKWLAGELDAARDLDVFIGEGFSSIDPDPGDREAFARLGVQLLHAQSDAYERALKALASERFAQFVLTAARWIQIGAWAQADEPVAKSLRESAVDQFAREQLDRMHRQVRRRGRHLARLSAQERHQLRIKAKKLRYATEFFSETFDRPKLRKRFLKVISELQDDLGALHDTSVLPKLVFDYSRIRSAKAGFAAGLIVARRRKAAKKAERAALQSVDAFRRAEPFWD